jgi:hypothetical protein
LNGLAAIQAANVVTDEATGSTSYGPLATAGPSVMITTGVSGRVLLALTAGILNSTGSSLGYMSFTCSPNSGADCTSTGSDVTALNLLGNNRQKATASFVLQLTPNTTYTFTAVYKILGPGTVSFQNRSIWAAPL